MKAKNVILLTALGLFLTTSVAESQVFTARSHTISVKGTSSLHEWQSNVEKLECSGSVSIQDGSLHSIEGIYAKIPVTAIKSTKGKMMDSKTWEAFNHEKYPTISFTLTKNRIVRANSLIEASGTLTMAGVSRPIDLALTYTILPNGELRVTGSKKLAMTAFKMEPPTAMMGTIKVGDEVEVVLDVTLDNSNNSL